jgi:hypothetical protein
VRFIPRTLELAGSGVGGESNEEDAMSVKPAYERPAVAVLGSIRDLTLAVGAGTPIDACFTQSGNPVAGSPGGTVVPNGLNCQALSA